jgi:hypothetical protein
VGKRVVSRVLHGPAANYYPTILEIATDVREVMHNLLKYPNVPTIHELASVLTGDKVKLRAITRRMSERRGRVSHMLMTFVWKELRVISDDPEVDGLLERKEAYRLYCGVYFLVMPVLFFCTLVLIHFL